MHALHCTAQWEDGLTSVGRLFHSIITATAATTEPSPPLLSSLLYSPILSTILSTILLYYPLSSSSVHGQVHSRSGEVLDHMVITKSSTSAMDDDDGMHRQTDRQTDRHAFM